MTKYQSGEMLDLVPPCFAEDPDWIAFSYALKKGTAAMLQYMKLTSMYAVLDEQPAEILDYMAVESRCIYYDESWNLAKKRDAIEENNGWYRKAGTPAAVTRLVDTAFGENTVVEWFDFPEQDGQPGEFDINITADITLTPEMYAKFTRAIENVKALSAHLRNLTINRPVMIERYLAPACLHNIRSVVISTVEL